MRDDPNTVSVNFWKNQKAFPEYNANIKLRRLHEINYFVPRLQSCETITDLGCGDGSLISCLRNLTNITRYYAYDISAEMLVNLELYDDVTTNRCDFSADSNIILEQTDVTISTGVLNYIFDTESVMNLLKKINSPVFYSRVICQHDESVTINKYSNDLKEEYASIYRTVDEYMDVFKSVFSDVKAPVRCYPDEMESKYGTKQYYVECRHE
ncbi:class I SAM-dependent methyltransferase [bacterium]|nr:class I SAM-dependent methyltransferase [bacterium]